MSSKGFESRFPARTSPAVKALASNVRALRKDRDWSQAKLADEVGVEQNAISLIENGRANPTVVVLEQIAHALGRTATGAARTHRGLSALQNMSLLLGGCRNTQATGVGLSSLVVT
jgi:transcriptional regulator with XRE-family HTH domain